MNITSDPSETRTRNLLFRNLPVSNDFTGFGYRCSTRNRSVMSGLRTRLCTSPLTGSASAEPACDHRQTHTTDTTVGSLKPWLPAECAHGWTPSSCRRCWQLAYAKKEGSR